MRSQQYVAQWDKLGQQAQSKGMEFLEPDRKIRYRTVKYKDQIAVLVGGFKSDEDVRKGRLGTLAANGPRPNRRSRITTAATCS